MLSIDMRDLSERQLKDIVADHCSSLGVTALLTLRVVVPDERSSYGAAALKVSTVEDAQILARNLGDSQCGCNVIINLLQKGRAVPYPPRRNHFFHGGNYVEQPEPPALDD
ncbi:MAG: hypothetical protein JWN94_3865 [Betaproteobacteria bacterium]|nr:hypothetical protein [Betaproteobacteria bacterium]